LFNSLLTILFTSYLKSQNDRPFILDIIFRASYRDRASLYNAFNCVTNAQLRTHAKSSERLSD